MTTTTPSQKIRPMRPADVAKARAASLLAAPFRTLHTNDCDIPVMVEDVEVDACGWVMFVSARDDSPAWEGTDHTATLYSEDGKVITGACWHLDDGTTHYENFTNDGGLGCPLTRSAE